MSSFISPLFRKNLTSPISQIEKLSEYSWNFSLRRCIRNFTKFNFVDPDREFFLYRITQKLCIFTESVRNILYFQIHSFIKSYGIYCKQYLCIIYLWNVVVITENFRLFKLSNWVFKICSLCRWKSIFQKLSRLMISFMRSN